MKKKLLERGILGIFVGLALEQLNTIINSLISGKGDYIAVPPEFAEAIGSELNAVILQTVMYVIYGIVIGIAGLVLGYGKWSIAKQTGVFVAIFGVAWFPIFCVNYLIEHFLFGFFAYFCCLTVIYIFIWAILYISWKIEIRKMNKRIQKNNETE